MADQPDTPLEAAFNEGMAKGRAEGIAEGIAKGKEEERIRNIHNFAAVGADVAKIAQAMNMSEEEVHAIVNSKWERYMQ